MVWADVLQGFQLNYVWSYTSEQFLPSHAFVQGIPILDVQYLLLVLGLESYWKQIVQLLVVQSLVGISRFCWMGPIQHLHIQWMVSLISEEIWLETQKWHIVENVFGSQISKRLRSVRIKTLFPTAMTSYLDRCILVYVILDCCCKLYYCNNLTMKLHFAEICLSELLSVFYNFELENMSI